MNQEAAARKWGWRSGLEEVIGEQLREARVPFEFETLTGEYEVPAKRSRYTPDFVLYNGIVIETKGRWLTGDRQKIRLIREQHPDLDLRMVFGGTRRFPSLTPISKQSRTTYAKICETLGIPYADKRIPEEWLKEPSRQDRWAAIEAFRWAGAKSRRKAA